jgi:KDO2-lipid IV(A) lauroyltransferase
MRLVMSCAPILKMSYQPIYEGHMVAKIVLFLLRGLSWLPLIVARSLSRLLAHLMVAFNATPLSVSQVNLRLCYPTMPEKEIQALSRAHMEHFANILCETPQIWRKGYPWLIKNIVGFQGMEHLQATSDDPAGTIFLIPHHGSWEAIGIWLAQLAPLTSLYAPAKNPALDHWVKSSRLRSGMCLAPTNVRGVARLLKALKRGDNVAILPDQSPKLSGGAFSTLFGVPALTMTLTHNLIQRTRCRVIFVAAIRVKGGFEIVMQPAPEQIYSADQQASLLALNGGVESIVALAPSQYQWTYKRFRIQPDQAGQPDESINLYPKGPQKL